MVDQPPIVDGITAQPEKTSGSVERPRPSKARMYIVVGIAYGIFLLWPFFLLSVLPSRDGSFDFLIPIGIFSLLGAAGLAVFIMSISVVRVLRAKQIPEARRVWLAIRATFLLLPILIIGVVVSFLITREPALPLNISDPVDVQAFIAPVSITFSAEEAVMILDRKGLKVSKFGWDFEGDGKMNQETVIPSVTALYEKQGLYRVAARLALSDGTERRLVRAVSIPQAVFGVRPLKPIIDEPVEFDVSHLVTKEAPLREVQWDFDGDGEVDEVTEKETVLHTFLRSGTFPVAAQILFQNQSEIKMARDVIVEEPEPLPFPVTITTDPEYLVSPAPFTVLFSLQTDEPIKDVTWEFADGTIETGERVAHTFRNKNVERVITKVRSQEGVIAEVKTLVRVVDVLKIDDLTFDGTPEVRNKIMTAEVPITVELSPRSAVQFVEFRWETPNATTVESRKGNLKATYRKPGTYSIILIASDASGSATRIPLTLNAEPPSSLVDFRLNPDGGVAPLLVHFDASETAIRGEEISGFEWLFGDDSDAAPRQGGAQIEHLYETPGTYEVKLRAFTTKGKTFDIEKTIVIRTPLLDACFTASRTSGKAPLGVSFDMSCTTGTATKIEWRFGDSASSDQRNPIHVFDKTGEYTVTLLVTDALGSVSTEVLVITATP